MEKVDIDELYHLLRVASNDAATITYASDSSKIFGLARHLLAGGDYLALIQFEAWYGENFLLTPAYEFLLDEHIIPKTIIDIGAGSGWLGRGLACAFATDKVFTVDKRPWGGITHMLNMESAEDRQYLREQYPPDNLGTTLITMCDFLHCVDCPRDIIQDFADYPMLILEYMGYDDDDFASYKTQLNRYGANVHNPDDYPVFFEGMNRVGKLSVPYGMVILQGRE